MTKGRQFMKPVFEYRDEQMLCAEILRRKLDVLPGHIKTEYPVEGLEWEGEKIGCVLDVAIVPTGVQYKIAIRLNGEIHTKKRNENHDEKQKLALEAQGWQVFDFWDWKMPNLWSKERTPEIDKKAELEILKMLE